MIKVDNKTFNAISFYVANTTMKNVSRETLFITIKDSTYEEINSTFVDGIEIIKIDNQPLLSSKETSYGTYSVAGEIRDNRNGTFTVLMGKKTALEIAQERVLALENENAELLFQNLTGEEFTK